MRAWRGRSRHGVKIVRTPRIAITPGEPAGVGPDLCVLAAQVELPAELIVVADPELLIDRAELLGQSIDLIPFEEDSQPTPHRSGSLKVLPVRLRRPVRAGLLDPANAAYVLDTLSLACDDCLVARFDALVTGPVHKGVINDGGLAFTGHTEFLAERCGAFPVMMLAAPGLRVALATTHVPISEVSSRITQAGLERVIRILEAGLRKRLGIPHPRVLVCGLNPHAGEGGYLGREEIEIIEPVLDRLRDAGFDLLGPVPADTAFLPDRLEGTDAVLAMYHDQGLPVLKQRGFGRAVNITLGLPIIRTSVDHGTALDVAGSGRVDSGSLVEAILTAADMVALQSA
jgi:4-hydroxythreonine-4-phosphate dehydrogenase